MAGQVRGSGTCSNSRNIWTYWYRNAVILAKFVALAAPQVIKIRTFSAPSDENFIKMTIILFQCTVLFCFLLLWLYHQFTWEFLWSMYPYSSLAPVALLARGQSYDCRTARDEILKNMGEIGWYHYKQRKVRTCIFPQMYCNSKYWPIPCKLLNLGIRNFYNEMNVDGIFHQYELIL